MFDPDLDPGGRYAGLLTSVLTTGLQHLGDSRAQPRPCVPALPARAHTPIE